MLMIRTGLTLPSSLGKYERVKYCRRRKSVGLWLPCDDKESVGKLCCGKESSNHRWRAHWKKHFINTFSYPLKWCQTKYLRCHASKEFCSTWALKAKTILNTESLRITTNFVESLKYATVFPRQILVLKSKILTSALHRAKREQTLDLKHWQRGQHCLPSHSSFLSS